MTQQSARREEILKENPFLGSPSSGRVDSCAMRRCQRCRHERILLDFEPLPFCGSPDSPHDLCRACQHKQRNVCGEALHTYFFGRRRATA